MHINTSEGFCLTLVNFWSTLFDIFMNITKEDVRRVARTYFTEENRMVLTILPPASAGRSFLRPGGDQ